MNANRNNAKSLIVFVNAKFNICNYYIHIYIQNYYIYLYLTCFLFYLLKYLNEIYRNLIVM